MLYSGALNDRVGHENLYCSLLLRHRDQVRVAVFSLTLLGVRRRARFTGRFLCPRLSMADQHCYRGD
jgi:hypothetical protein